ncbi:sensor histidine kinase [Enterococcus sp. LJL90]
MKDSSIKDIFRKTNIVMIAIAIIPLLISVIFYTRQIFIYQQTIGNIQEANAVSETMRDRALESMYDLAYGQISIEDFQDNNVIDEVREDIYHIQENVQSNSELNRLDVALRTLSNLEDYQNQLVTSVENDESYEEGEAILSNAEAVVDSVIDFLDRFVRLEIDLASQTNQELIRSVFLLTLAQGVILLVIFYFIRRNSRFLRKKVEDPLKNLVELSKKLSNGELNFRAEIPDTIEMKNLTYSLNKMAEDLTQLLEENALKQYHLAQSEIRVLQAQITPHFIYNSLDAIVSLIEAGDYRQAIEMTYALSDFFRISLSKGTDWISLEQEIRHVEDYLKILQIRYGAMLNYTISYPEELKEEEILKMILQPLVENAVYHGTKFVRRRGLIEISVTATTTDWQIVVSDNGIGMTPEKLQEITDNLNEGLLGESENGYGLHNVYQRIMLNYNGEASFKIESIYRTGTSIYIVIPKKHSKETAVSLTASLNKEENHV